MPATPRRTVARLTRGGGKCLKFDAARPRICEILLRQPEIGTALGVNRQFGGMGVAGANRQRAIGFALSFEPRLLADRGRNDCAPNALDFRPPMAHRIRP